jgi:hypothetical protein
MFTPVPFSPQRVRAEDCWQGCLSLPELDLGEGVEQRFMSPLRECSRLGSEVLACPVM